MAKFRQITQGTRARKPVTLTFGESEVVVDVRPLVTSEEADALAAARAFAAAKGLPDPKEGQPVYDLAVLAHYAHAACVDHDSPADAPAPFFDSPEQAASLDRDRLQVLFEAWSAWQEQCSPRRLTLTPEQYAGLVYSLAEGGAGSTDDPFLLKLPRATLVSCMRTMAAQLVASPMLRSPSSSSGSPAGADDSRSA